MLIIISGSINSGKSTVAKIVAEKLPKTASIELDKLREFVPFLPLDKKLIDLNIKNSADVANNFFKAGLNVIINYPLSKDNYENLVKNIDLPKEEIFTFTLNPRLEVASSNRGSRELNEWEKQRVAHHYKIGINKPDFKTVTIDNSDQTAEETANIILNNLKK